MYCFKRNLCHRKCKTNNAEKHSISVDRFDIICKEEVLEELRSKEKLWFNMTSSIQVRILILSRI